MLQAVQKSAADSLEASILECPAGMQALVEVLRDPREEVRNEVILLLGQVRARQMWICPRSALLAGGALAPLNIVQGHDLGAAAPLQSCVGTTLLAVPDCDVWFLGQALRYPLTKSQR